MKKLFLAMIFGIISTFVYAAPFGLKMGMTIEEIAEQCEEEPSYVKDDIYLVKPTKSHPLFSYYAVYVNEKTGLYQIRAISDSVTCNDYGTEIQNAFNTVKDRIAKTYGKPRVINKVDASLSEYMKQDKNWFQAFKDGARQLSAIWGEKTELADNLVSVALDCVADTDFLSYDKAHLVLYYYFSNAKSVEDEQDDVF
ncbi:MAG: hypothetical protein IJ191_02335 [Treponema sp.]|nr:hypothetical protein [Treponema sp.]